MNKLSRLVKVGVATATVMAMTPVSIFAQGTGGAAGKTTTSIDIKPTDAFGQQAFSFSLGGILRTGIGLVLGFAGLIAFFMLLIGGLQWLVSGGDKEGTEKARKRITAALIGLAIVFAAFAIIFIVNQIFGVDFTNVVIPKITG